MPDNPFSIDFNKVNSYFQIDDSYLVSHNDKKIALLSGYIKKGDFIVGESIVICDDKGDIRTSATIVSLEKIGRDAFNKIEFVEGGNLENAYAILVDSDNLELFQKGHFVASFERDGNVVNPDKLDEEHVKKILDDVLNANESDYSKYSIQELCAILQILSNKEFDEKVTLKENLGTVLCEKIASADTLYLTIENTTKQPFINNGLVDVYSKESFALDAIEFYKKQFRTLSLYKFEKEKENIPLFIWLRLLGVKQFMVDNGQFHIPLLVEFFKNEQAMKDQLIVATNEHPALYNPDFRYAMNVALSELRWTVDYDERDANCKSKDKAMWEEFKKAALIVVTKKVDENNKDEGLSIPHINNENKEEFIPIFTDLSEANKVFKLQDWSITVFPYEQILNLDDNVGIVINPHSENLVLTVDKLKEYRDKIINGNGPVSDN